MRPLLRARMLPPAAFTDRRVFDWELERVYRDGWICAAHLSAVAEPGAYVTRELGGDSFFVIGGEDGVPRAFYNVCRHRAARILGDAAGSARRRIRCPYHAWSYDFQGMLRAAPHTDGLDDFDFSCNGLRPIRTAVVDGLVMVNLGGTALDPADHIGDLGKILRRYRVSGLRPAGERLYEVDANWKAIPENYNECLHCPGVHPELNALSDYASGDAVEGEGAWCGGSMTLNEGAETMGREGGHAARAPIEGLGAHELGTVLYFSLFPNALISMHPDYVMLHTLWPREPGHTRVTCEWLFEPRIDRCRGLRRRRTRSTSGIRSTPRTGAYASSRSRVSARAATRPAVTRPMRATRTHSTGWSPSGTWRRFRDERDRRSAGRGGAARAGR